MVFAQLVSLPRDSAETARILATGTARPMAMDMRPRNSTGSACTATIASAVLKRQAVCHIPAKSRYFCGPSPRMNQASPQANSMPAQTPSPITARSAVDGGLRSALTKIRAGNNRLKLSLSIPCHPVAGKVSRNSLPVISNRKSGSRANTTVGIG
ncbi:hypothetical protein D9M72_527420 [compost metagenome]